MADIAALSNVSPTLVIALLLAAVVVILLRFLFGAPRQADRTTAWEPECQQLAEDLEQWAADLRVLATSLRLGHWGDVRYALQWRTLDPPGSLVEALDWDSIDGHRAEAIALTRVLGHADELAQIAVMVDGAPLLQGGAVATRATVAYAAADYANALLVLADGASQARAGLEPDGQLAPFSQSAA